MYTTAQVTRNSRPSNKYQGVFTRDIRGITVGNGIRRSDRTPSALHVREHLATCDARPLHKMGGSHLLKKATRHTTATTIKDQICLRHGLLHPHCIVQQSTIHRKGSHPPTQGHAHQTPPYINIQASLQSSGTGKQRLKNDDRPEHQEVAKGMGPLPTRAAIRLQYVTEHLNRIHTRLPELRP